MRTYLGAVLVSPGVYTLKLGVADGRGKRGSVEHSFRAAPGQLKSASVVVEVAQRDVGRTLDSAPLIFNPREGRWGRSWARRP